MLSSVGDKCAEVIPNHPDLSDQESDGITDINHAQKSPTR